MRATSVAERLIAGAPTISANCAMLVALTIGAATAGFANSQASATWPGLAW